MSMVWCAAATTAAVSMYSSSSAAASGVRTANANARDYNLSLEKQYLHSIVRNSYQTGILNVQLGLEKKRAAQTGFEQTAQAAALQGQAQAMAGASGTVGASVDAVASDIEMKLGEAQAVSADNYEQMLDNYNSELMLNKINATSEVLATSPAKVHYEGPSAGEMFGTALLAGLAQGFGTMAKDSMKLGLGKISSTAGSGMASLGGLGSGVSGGINISAFKWGE